jgi:ribonuclease R
LGEEYDAVISSVTNFGMFVELDPLYIEGLVHVTELGEDYFHFDPVRHCLKGERTGKIYRIGDRVRVQVAQVVLDTRKIDLRLINQTDEQTPANSDQVLIDQAVDASEPVHEDDVGDAKKKRRSRSRSRPNNRKRRTRPKEKNDG